MMEEEGTGVDILDLEREEWKIEEVKQEDQVFRNEDGNSADVLEVRSEPPAPEDLMDMRDEDTAGICIPSELSEDAAAFRLQRCMRGMMDRIFFRKFQKLQLSRKRDEHLKETRR